MNLYKHPKFGHVYGDKIVSGKGRIAWPYLIKPKENTFPVKEGEQPLPPKFEVTFLFPKKGIETKSFIKEVTEMAEDMAEMFNQGKKVKITVDPDSLFKDGDAMDEEKFPYFAGNWFLTAKNKDLPELYDTEVEEITPDKFTAGHQAVVVVKPICTSHGISYQLITVQLGIDDNVRWSGASTQKDSKDLLKALKAEGIKNVPDKNEDADEEQEETPDELAPPIAAKASKRTRNELNLSKIA